MYHGRAFTDTEIDQIVALVQSFPTHYTDKPIDARKLSKNVIRWAQILVLEYRNAAGPCSYWEKGARLYFCDQVRYGWNWHHMPVEVIWRLVAPMIARSRGFGITSDPAWAQLNINPLRGYTLTNEIAQQNAITEMMDVLGVLSSYGYIYFQFGGSIWSISVTKQEAA